jgi:hypothetical protein
VAITFLKYEPDDGITASLILKAAAYAVAELKKEEITKSSTMQVLKG